MNAPKLGEKSKDPFDFDKKEWTFQFADFGHKRVSVRIGSATYRTFITKTDRAADLIRRLSQVYNAQIANNYILCTGNIRLSYRGYLQNMLSDEECQNLVVIFKDDKVL